ncbi:MAG: antibiotic biosynthesis monooxygenase [Pseudomonadota bacterium]
MKLITVEVEFGASDLSAAVDLISGQVDTVLAMPGCTHYALYRKPSDDGVAIVQQWDGMAAFDAYRGSETFAALGAGLRPLMVKPPVTTIAEVDTL